MRVEQSPVGHFPGKIGMLSSKDENNTATPLCVDLDGTLIHSDILLESLVCLLRKNPLYLFLFPFWLMKGKASFKAKIACRTHLKMDSLPYYQEFLSWLISEKEKGRDLWLATASHRIQADAVADHLGIFEGVLASSDRINLSGARKAMELVKRFGEEGFDYCGNDRVDLAIWRHARNAIVVNGDQWIKRKLSTLGKLHKDFPSSASRLKSIIMAARPHQWTKNILLFVPLIAAHKFDLKIWLNHGVPAFAAFSFCASSVYLLNDMVDLEADREHPLKRHRPFASGALSLIYGFWAVPILILFAMLSAISLPRQFTFFLAGYLGLTLVYSLFLKRMEIIDVMALAMLYTIRIVAGAAAVSVPLSFWLLLFSVFLFLSLALVKRYAELQTLRENGKLAAAGRGYHVEDLSMLLGFGASAGYMSVLVLGLYINSPVVESLYRYPMAIWMICILLLFWINRIWMKAHRGLMHDDPLIFSLKDSMSWGIGILSLISFWMAI